MFQIINNFITAEDKLQILDWVNTVIIPDTSINNIHINAIEKETKGAALLYDFTKTNLSKTISEFQGDCRQIDNIPPIIHDLQDRIIMKLGVNKEHSFVQLIMIGENGNVKPHYDLGIPGYLTYKCNIQVVGTDILHVDKEKMHINPNDLYAFEANLYKHWNEKSTARIVLSFGFVVPYKDLLWDENHPRIRLSNRLWKMFGQTHFKNPKSQE